MTNAVLLLAAGLAAPPATQIDLETPEAPGWQASWRMPLGGTVLGVGVASTLAGVALGFHVRNLDEEANRIFARSHGGISPDEFDVASARLAEINDEGPRVEQLQLAAFITGSALAIAGVGFILWDLLREPATQLRAPAESFRVLVGPGSLGLRIDL